MTNQDERPVTEWPTLVMIAATYSVWAVSTTIVAGFWLPLAILITAFAIAQFSSLQHECLHGHPFRNKYVNAALVFPALTLIVPYLRFRDTHLDHHNDSRLTDPYDDPETNFLDPGKWEHLPRAAKILLEINNSLAGRIFLGPIIGTAVFFRNDLKTWRTDARVRRGWLFHIPALVPIILWLTYVGSMPFWAYALAAYFGLGLLRIRTFLEHQAHERSNARTVIIDDCGPLSLLFLNNNYHAVHHAHPAIPWYRLRRTYRSDTDKFLRANDGYYFTCYGAIFRQYLLRRKDPVAHPLWRRS